MQQCRGTFNVKTTTLVAEQCLKRMEYLHSKCIIHRDIKPENFMFGIKNKIHHLYLIDFGLSKHYFHDKHVPIRTRLNLTGTARYASINAHRGRRVKCFVEHTLGISGIHSGLLAVWVMGNWT